MLFCFDIPLLAILLRSGAVNLFSVCITVMIGRVRHSLKDTEALMGIIGPAGVMVGPVLSWRAGPGLGNGKF